MVEIREAKKEDIPALRRVAIATQIDTFGEQNTVANMQAFLKEAYSIEKFEEELAEPASVYYLAWVGNRLAGFLRLRESPEVEHLLGDNTLELQRLYVDKSFQGEGIGKRLMEFALDYATRLGYEYLWLGVWERNFKAQKIYERWGFERFSEHVFQMGDDPQTDWLLKRRLKG